MRCLTTFPVLTYSLNPSSIIMSSLHQRAVALPGCVSATPCESHGAARQLELKLPTQKTLPEDGRKRANCPQRQQVANLGLHTNLKHVNEIGAMHEKLQCWHIARHGAWSPKSSLCKHADPVARHGRSVPAPRLCCKPYLHSLAWPGSSESHCAAGQLSNSRQTV